MLRIEKESNGGTATLWLSGRMQSEHIPCLREQLKSGCGRVAFDLAEVTLVDIDAVLFLTECEDHGIELASCPAFVREWIARERAEGGRQPG